MIAAQLKNFVVNLFQWWVVITPWEQGVRVRMGRHETLLRAGIHLKLPIIDKVYKQPIRLRAQFVKGQTVTSADGKTLTIAGAIQYEIVDLLRLYRTLHNAHDVIEQKVQATLALYCAGVDAEWITPECLRDEVKQAVDLTTFGMRSRGYTVTNIAMVRTLRIVTGEIGDFTGYDQRLETSFAVGESAR